MSSGLGTVTVELTENELSIVGAALVIYYEDPVAHEPYDVAALFRKMIGHEITAADDDSDGGSTHWPPERWVGKAGA